MEHLNKFPQKLLTVLKKYKYAALVLLLGVLLLLLPFGKEKKEEPMTASEEALSDSDYAQQMEARLEGMLTQIDGAGRVKVMLTLQSGSRTEYQTDTQITDGGTQRNEEHKTVILSEGSAYDKAAVSAVRYPRFQGALIITEGALQPSVRLNLMNAVAALTGLSSDQITVVKMK